MNIAAIQLDIRWEDRAANHARVRELVSSRKISPGTLLVLPETFDTGFSMNKAVTDPGAESASENFCRALAREHGIAVLAGIVARTNDGPLANEAVAFAPDGRELARYRKMQPFTGAKEHECHVAGTSHVVFVWQGTKIAPFICYDLRFPELFRPAARDGAELMIVIANWPKVRSEHWVRLLQARAIENQGFVLGVNRCGDDPALRYDGRSALFDPMGNTLFEADGREQVIQHALDPADARAWRDNFPALRDIRHC
ncbi:MAG TPA: nitrilase-related carbon-nitrogen hydrolase [Tepidisphaeraceae bacterium]|nr:nitrilase-related carbon-nitrogen hydrolase [Tepidisphaeraceae bacterium]